MDDPLTKSALAIALSRMQVFAHPHERSEQYPTDSEIAAEVLWLAKMQGDIEDRNVIDLGCGTGILGLGALLLGASRCTFVDRDPAALATLQENLDKARTLFDAEIEKKSAIQKSDYTNVTGKADVVVQNPPFGTRQKHIDVEFLRKAMELAPIVYSFHKTITRDYVIAVAEKEGFHASHMLDVAFPLKATQAHHRRKIHRIAVSAIRFVKGQA